MPSDLIERLREKDREWQAKCDRWLSEGIEVSAKAEIAMRHTWQREAADTLEAQATEIAALKAKVERLEKENTRAWRERNIAYAKVKAWEDVVYIENLPLRTVPVDEWGPEEGETTTVPEVTRKKLTDLLNELSTLRQALKEPADDRA